MKVSVVQFAPALLECKKNLDTISVLLAQCDADLVVLPELCVSGYLIGDRAQLETCSERPGEGPLFHVVHDYSRASGAAVIAGFVERAKEVFYNSAMLVTPDGLTGVYRKTHLFGNEPSLFQAGDSGFNVFDVGGVRIGIMICYDWRFPEAARTLALQGADMICHPSDLVAGAHLWKPVMQTRSFENRVFVATANRTGFDRAGDTELRFSGSSQITDISGKILAELGADETGVCTAEIDPLRARNKAFSAKNDIFTDRRPEFYRQS